MRTNGSSPFDIAANATRKDGKPKLLFLCQTLPFPPDGGVHLRSYNILRLLAQAFDVTALCFYRKATRPTSEQVAEGLAGLGELSKVEAFPIPQEISRPRLIWDHLRSVLLGNPYTRYAYKSSAFTARLKELLQQGSFDLVHMDSLDLSVYLPLLEGIPVICTHHNVESALLRRRANAEPWPVRPYVAHQSRLTRKEEEFWVPRVPLNLAVSRNDRDDLAALAPEARFMVVPNGVDTQVFTPGNVAEKGIVFVGGYSWQPNREAMGHFSADILPEIVKRTGPVDVTWVGRAPESVQRHFSSRHGVRMTGFVDDIRPYVQGAACYVAPLRTGGGTRLKILDAWAMGKAVVSTTVGCEGLDAVDGENILIRDEPVAFANAVADVMSDTNLRERLGTNARKTVERTYDWSIIGSDLIEAYQSIALSPTHSMHMTADAGNSNAAELRRGVQE